MLSKKLQKKNRAQLHRLLDIVLDGNGFEDREQEKTGDLPTLFFDFSGHVSLARVRLHSNGWKALDNPDIAWDLYTDREITDAMVDNIGAVVSLALNKEKEDEADT